MRPLHGRGGVAAVGGRLDAGGRTVVKYPHRLEVGNLSSPERSPTTAGGKRTVPDIPETTLKELQARARSVSEHAYCPYSKFHVGAAVLAEGGQIFAGCNVENVSYGLTICAERNAVFQMVAHAKKPILAVVVYTPTQKPTTPCGACRQVINEFGPDALIISVCDGPDVVRKKLSELLPDAFGAPGARP
jgi:cytidine deaminase